MRIGKRFWFGLCLGAAALALFFLTTDWSRLVEALSEANYWYAVPAVLLYQVSLLFRTARWQMLMRHMREGPDPQALSSGGRGVHGQQPAASAHR